MNSSIYSKLNTITSFCPLSKKYWGVSGKKGKVIKKMNGIINWIIAAILYVQKCPKIKAASIPLLSVSISNEPSLPLILYSGKNKIENICF